MINQSVNGSHPLCGWADGNAQAVDLTPAVKRPVTVAGRCQLLPWFAFTTCPFRGSAVPVLRCAIQLV